MQTFKIGIVEIFRSFGSLRIKSLKLLDLIVGSILARILKEKKQATISFLQIESILIIRPGGIGDAVFLLPILRRIKQQQPCLKIDILCEKRNREIFASQPDLYRAIYCYDDFKSFLSLFRNRYDAVIDTEQWHYLSALTAYFLKSKMTVGFATRPLRAKLFTHRVDYGLNTYELENFKTLFQPLLGPCEDVKDINLCYTLSEIQLNWARNSIPEKSVTLFLGGSIPPRRLTQEQAMDITRYILKKDYAVVLLGGKDVEAMGGILGRQSRDKRILNYTGKVSLEQSAALIKRSKLFIGTDSGLMHLACAVGTPVIGIFGPGNLEKWRPRGEGHSVVTENLECSPCTRFGYTVPTCRGGYQCMRELDLEKIVGAIENSI